MKIRYLTLPILLSTSVFSAENETPKDLEIPQLSKQEIAQEEFPIVSIFDIIQNQVHKKSYVEKEGLLSFVEGSLHESKTPIKNAVRYTTTYQEWHINYIVASLSDKVKIDLFDRFIFDPSAMDGSGQSGAFLIPITGIKSDSSKHTFRISVKKVTIQEAEQPKEKPTTSLSTLQKSPLSIAATPQVQPETKAIKVEESLQDSSSRNRGKSFTDRFKKLSISSKKEDASPTSTGSPGASPSSSTPKSGASPSSSPSSTKASRSMSKTGTEVSETHKSLIDELKKKQEQDKEKNK